MLNNIKNGTMYCPALEEYVRKHWIEEPKRKYDASKDEYLDCIDNYPGQLTKINTNTDRYEMVEWRDLSMPEMFYIVAERVRYKKTGEENYRIISNYKETYNALSELKDRCPCCSKITRDEILKTCKKDI